MIFLTTLPPDGDARDAFLLAALAAGVLDAPTWIRVRMGRVEIEVSADYLAMRGERVPMAPLVAHAAVESLGALLPTPAIVDAIEAAAVIVPAPTWAPPAGQDRSAQTSNTVFALCEQRTRAAFEARGVQAGQLIAGHRKDVVISDYMPDGEVVIYGARWPDGRRLQPLYPKRGGKPGHADYYEDYLHGVRAVRAACWLDGEPARVTEILSGPLAHLLGGPVERLGYVAPRPSSATTAATTAKPTLRLGDSGPAVREMQRLIHAEADGAFGLRTEVQLRAFQRARGLPATGICDAPTWAALASAPATKAAATPRDGTGEVALAIALIELAAGIAEAPPGSNTGVRVRQYLAGCVRDLDRDGDEDALGLTAADWCAAFVGWCDSQVSVPRTWRAAVTELCSDARRAGTLRDPANYTPRPGDLAIFTRAGQSPLAGGLGHVGRVELCDGPRLVTIDGNHDSRVARVERALQDSDLVAFIEYPRGET